MRTAIKSISFIAIIWNVHFYFIYFFFLLLATSSFLRSFWSTQEAKIIRRQAIKSLQTFFLSKSFLFLSFSRSEKIPSPTLTKKMHILLTIQLNLYLFSCVNRKSIWRKLKLRKKVFLCCSEIASQTHVHRQKWETSPNAAISSLFSLVDRKRISPTTKVHRISSCRRRNDLMSR